MERHEHEITPEDAKPDPDADVPTSQTADDPEHVVEEKRSGEDQPAQHPREGGR